MPDRLRFEVYEKAVIVSASRRCGTSASSWGGYAVLLICQLLSRLAVARAENAEWRSSTPTRRAVLGGRGALVVVLRRGQDLA